MIKSKSLILYALFAISTCSSVKAQLPNSNCENWTVAGRTDSLIGWSSSNSVVLYPVVSLRKEDVNPYQGSNAIHLSTAPFGFVQYSTVGVLVNGIGTFSYGGGGGNNSVELQSGGGSPISHKPNELKGYYKAPTNTIGNLPFAKILLTKYNGITNSRDTVSYTEYNFSTNFNYASFTIPLVDLMPGVIPDSITTIFYSSNPATVGAFGVFADLYLDSLEIPVAVTYGTDTQIACNSYTWIDGNTYTVSNNTATDTLVNTNGIDSIVTLNLTINTSSASTDIQVACNSFKWIDGNTYTSSNTTASQVFTNSVGCDSVVTLDLTINQANSNVTQVGEVLTANENGATYQWLDCPAMTAISGANAQSYTATIDGDYAVMVTKNGCSDTSICFSVLLTTDIDNKFGQKFLLYPNPTEGILWIDLGVVIGVSSYTMRTIDGRIIKTGKTATNKISIDLGSESSGVYFLTLHNDKNTSTYKVFKR